MSGFPPWHLQVLLSLQLLRHLLEKIRRPQVKRGFIPNEAADILFGGGIVDFVKAFVQNCLQRLQIKRLRPVKEGAAGLCEKAPGKPNGYCVADRSFNVSELRILKR